MIINVDLLQRTFAHIEQHPDTWNQKSWAVQSQRYACGTAYCFAGHAVLLAGREITFDDAPALAGGIGGRFQDYISTGESIEEAATRELGLQSWHAERLFHPSNDLDRLREIVTELVEEGQPA